MQKNDKLVYRLISVRLLFAVTMRPSIDVEYSYLKIKFTLKSKA